MSDQSDCEGMRASDPEFFELHPDRFHRVRLADHSECARLKTLPCGQAWFAAVRRISEPLALLGCPGSAFASITFAHTTGAHQAASEDQAQALFEWAGRDFLEPVGHWDAPHDRPPGQRLF